MAGKVKTVRSSVAMSGSADLSEAGRRRSDAIAEAMNAAVRALTERGEHDPAKHLEAALKARDALRARFAKEEAAAIKAAQEAEARAQREARSKAKG